MRVNHTAPHTDHRSRCFSRPVQRLRLCLILAAVVGSAVPAMVHAAVSLDYPVRLYDQVLTLINVYLMPLVVSAAFLFFVWGMVVFITFAGDDTKREEGKQRMVWGIVALFVIVSVWGIILILQEIFGVQGGTPLTLPRTGP